MEEPWLHVGSSQGEGEGEKIVVKFDFYCEVSRFILLIAGVFCYINDQHRIMTRIGSLFARIKTVGLVLILSSFGFHYFVYRTRLVDGDSFTYEKALITLKHAANELKAAASKENAELRKRCSDIRLGNTKNSSWGVHHLCNLQPPTSCLFYSFGIAYNYEFELELVRKWNCQGVAFDPLIIHRSKIHQNITFHMIGARTLSKEADRRWLLVSSVPSLQACFRHRRIHVLKMDCEGCEYALGEDIEKENRDFFLNVDQFSVEVHTSKFWISTKRHIYYFAKLFYYLKKARLEIIDVQLVACSRAHEDYGCPDELIEAGYPCSRGKMCQNILFARLPQ